MSQMKSEIMLLQLRWHRADTSHSTLAHTSRRVHLELHVGNADVSIPHAFGEALALAWFAEQVRGIIDIDVNLFVDPDQCHGVFVSLPQNL